MLCTMPSPVRSTRSLEREGSTRKKRSNTLGSASTEFRCHVSATSMRSALAVCCGRDVTVPGGVCTIAFDTRLLIARQHQRADPIHGDGWCVGCRNESDLAAPMPWLRSIPHCTEQLHRLSTFCRWTCFSGISAVEPETKAPESNSRVARLLQRGFQHVAVFHPQFAEARHEPLSFGRGCC